MTAGDRPWRAPGADEIVCHDRGRCGAAAALPAFSGPGRKDDTCPIATTYALKALSLVPAAQDSHAVTAGIMALLDLGAPSGLQAQDVRGRHGLQEARVPLVWYDILHVSDVLSRYPAARADLRFRQMVTALTSQADAQGRYTAGSMYRAWSGWSFADKTSPSAWLTFLVRRICARLAS